MTTHHVDERDRVQVFSGDCLTVLAELHDASVDAVVTDPPYDLTGKNGAGGFMGKQWDATGVAFNPDLWREVLRVLRPGGHLVSFGGTRTYHRLTCAIEDAGFEIRDSIGHAHAVPLMSWVYASGFPKSLDVSKAIDKAAGAKREVVGTGPDHRKRTAAAGRGDTVCREGGAAPVGQIVTAPATPDAERWQGFGTALKPAWEPIVVARKPLTGTVAQTVLAHGTGALNIDGCRVGYVSPEDQRRVREWPRPNVPGRMTGFETTSGDGKTGDSSFSALGRWPSNVVLSHAATVEGSDACAEGCVDGCPVADLDAQSGVTTSSDRPRRNTAEAHNRTASMGQAVADWTTNGHADSGGASRFFPVFRYQAKAPTRERPKVDGVAHPTCKPLALMRWLVRLVTPPGGLVLEPFAGSGTTVEACLLEGLRCVAIEREADYLPLIAERIRRAHAAPAALFDVGAAS